ncbi:tyrosine-type recombinase/integrase [Natrinema halophilum]|uniref:Site-specific integrase n=1 Tax=Natrinema halophilum TaxID=1699371 RepID=A0A7D5H624_9EURY|nr:site-specific integrase [Natrinema halophilum]QLG48415.1 site-specific integrase [Natrinema halophilum]
MSDIAIADAVDAYLQRKAVGDPNGSGAGTYASNAESILRRWAEWLEAEHDVVSIATLGVDHMRAYAEELRRRTDRGEYTASTAGTYYAVVRAFLSWCVRGGICEANPAATTRAEATLPSGDSRPANDHWTARQRRELERYVRDRVLDVTAQSTSERRSRLREYAMVAVLAHSSVRGAELFRVPDDERRTGATWQDVDFYTGTIRVLGKSQRLEDVPLPARARTPLRRYRIVLDPPSNDWPLFPTAHAPSIAKRVRSALRERGYDAETIESLFDDATAMELAREHSIAPPAITTEGARSVLKRLCEGAGVDVDGDYLTPRGVRRNQGSDPYRQEASASKPTLRASVIEQSIVVSSGESPVIDVETGNGDESTETD